MDVSKLKVTELRAELSDRGLDTKGVKAVLVQRLLKAIEEETGEEQEQHTVLDTSTEEASDSEQRRSSKDSEPDQDPLLQDNRDSSPETETASAAPSVAVEPPTSEKDLSEVDEPDGSPQNAEESSSSNEVAYQQEDSTEYQQDNASSDVRAEYQIEDSTNTNDYQQSDSNVSSDFAKEKPVVYQENNSVEFQQGDNANQQWTNQQEEEAAPRAEPMEAENTTTHNGHSGEQGDESKAATTADDEKMDTSAVDTDKPDGEGEEDEGRSRKRRDRKNRWGPSDTNSEDGGTPDKRRKTGSESEDGGSSRRDKARTKDKTPEPEVKKPPQVEKPESEPEIDPAAFTLAWYDSDLNLVIDQDSFTYGSPMSDQGFVYMWAGVRSTYGFNKGKVYYEVNLKEYCDTSNYEADIFPHQLRVGLSLKNSSLQLGETEHSYAWETTGQLVANNEYKLFGRPATVEDSVGVLLDCDSDAEFILVRFTLNGEVLKLVRRIVKEPEPVDSEYEDIEEQVTDEDDAEEEEEEKKEEVTSDKEENKEEDSEEQKEPKEGEEKMEGVEEESKEDKDEKQKEESEKEEDKDKEKPAPVKKPKQKKYKTIITKKKLPKREKPVEYEYLPAEDGDDVAFRISKEELGEQHLFPHILTKNIKFEVNFGQKEEPWFPAPEGEEGWIFPSQIPLDERVPGAVRPEKRADCEMLMMCGLPGAGKTHWVREHLKNNPEKLYNVFGTFSLTNKMKINSEPLRSHMKGKWVQVIDKTTKCLNRLLELGYSRRRNYILDQTNVYVSAQKRKMRSYFGFQRKAMVVVPNKEDYVDRLTSHREKEGKDDVPPDHVILEMKANFKLPEVGELFEEVIFVEVQLEEAQKLITEYNKEGKDAGFGQTRDQARGGHGGGPPGGHRRRDSRDRGGDYPRRGGPPPFGRGFGGRGGRMDRMDHRMERMDHRPPMGGGMGWGGPPRDRRGGMGGGRGGGRWGGDRDDGRPPRGGGYGGRGGFGSRGPPPMHRGGDGEDGDVGPPPRREGGWRGADDRRGGGRGGRDDRSGGRGGWGGGNRQGGGSWGGPPGGPPEKSAEGGHGGFGGGPGGRGGFEARGRGRGGFGSSERRGGHSSDHRSGEKSKAPYQQGGGGGGWGSNQGGNAMQQHQGGWGGHQQGGWGQQGQNQNQQQWNQWNQQNWQNQWNQWNQQQWAGYGNQQQQQGAQGQGSTGAQSSAAANTGSHSAAATPAAANQNQAASYGTTGAASNSAANTAQGYNAAAYGNQSAAGYNAANYNGWTAAQYQQYYAAQGWTQNADGSYNCPQNWNAQNWNTPNWSGYGYSTTGQTSAAAGQTSQSGSK